ncbi:MAG TPA: zinc ribbon domain-containing protein [Anaerolineales bacterium]|jgi:putative FmdB family regulatory protein|nr:zinc ribbon domain-containing protein [Anaerolineales bacterium]
MPVYAYRCESCGVQFERHQSFADRAIKRCPECNKNSLRKVIGPVGVVFKGSGFYATDHKSPSKMKSKDDKEENSSSSEKSESKASTESAKKESRSGENKE